MTDPTPAKLSDGEIEALLGSVAQVGLVNEFGIRVVELNQDTFLRLMQALTELYHERRARAEADRLRDSTEAGLRDRIKDLKIEAEHRREADERALAGADEVVRRRIACRQWAADELDERDALLALLRERDELRRQLKNADAIVLSNSEVMHKGMEQLAALLNQHRDALRRACEAVKIECLRRFANGAHFEDALQRVRAIDLDSLLARDAEGRE